MLLHFMLLIFDLVWYTSSGLYRPYRLLGQRTRREEGWRDLMV